MSTVVPFDRARRRDARRPAPVPAEHRTARPQDRVDARPTRRAAPAEPLWREAVGAQLREERARRGERIADVAAQAGVSPQYLSEVERGRKDASSEVLAAVVGALGLTVAGVADRAAQRMSAVRGPVCLAA